MLTTWGIRCGNRAGSNSRALSAGGAAVAAIGLSHTRNCARGAGRQA